MSFGADDGSEPFDLKEEESSPPESSTAQQQQHFFVHSDNNEEGEDRSPVLSRDGNPTSSSLLRQILEDSFPSDEEDDSEFELVDGTDSSSDPPPASRGYPDASFSASSSSIRTRKKRGREGGTIMSGDEEQQKDILGRPQPVTAGAATAAIVKSPNGASKTEEGATPSPDRKKLRGVDGLNPTAYSPAAPTAPAPPDTTTSAAAAGIGNNNGPTVTPFEEEDEDDEEASDDGSQTDQAVCDDDATPLWLENTDRSPEKITKPPQQPASSTGIAGGHLFPAPTTTDNNDYANCRNLPPPRDNEVEFVIEDFLSIRCDPMGPTRLYSQTKVYNSVAFRVLVFPKGNHADRVTALKDLSAYVAVDPSGSLPPQFEEKWCLQRCEYQLIVINWRNWRERSILKSEQYTFMSDDPDRGWRELVPADGLKVGEFVGPTGQLIIRAQIVPKSVDASNHTYQGRQELGYIGIKNQGATCYLNSLVQALYHIGTFRKGVFELTRDSDREFIIDWQKHLQQQQQQQQASSSAAPQAAAASPASPKPSPTRETSAPSDAEDETLVRWNSDEIRQAFESETKCLGVEGDARGVSLALQALFLKMTTSNEVVTTDDLIKSFGWQSNESLTQHDAQELNRLLCDRLEEQMKGTPSEGAIEALFMGEFENYVECLDVPYGSSRREKFYDLQLDVQNMKDLYESLRNYTAEEILEGDNLYDAEHYGKQRARKGVRFIRFPPVIQFHLKRFTFDPTRMDMVKINQRFEYPEVLDLSRVLPGAGTYDLFCVIVHAGDVGGGHYYVINRPGGKRWWMKFDDEKVYPVSSHSALADSYGGHDGMCWDYLQHFDTPNYKAESTIPKLHSAYILFYVKSDLSQELLEEPDPDSVNPYLVVRQSREEEQKKRRIQIQRYVQRYVNVRYISEASLRGYKGFLSDIHTLPAFHEQRFLNETSIFNLWKAIEGGIQSGEVKDPLLTEMQGTYYLGLWYFDGTVSNRMTGRAADVRPLPCHINESARRPYTVGDHLSWISKSLRFPWKPTVSLLVHPLFLRERAKIRSITALATTLLEMRVFIAKIFNPGCKVPPRPSHEQTLVVAGISLLKFEKDRRQSAVPALLAELARTLADSAHVEFEDPEVQAFRQQLQSPFAPTTTLRVSTPAGGDATSGVHSFYLEEGGSFEPLPATGAALADRFEASRHSRADEPCPIIVFSLSPSAEALRLRDIAEAYGMGSGAETLYEDDTEVAPEELMVPRPEEELSDEALPVPWRGSEPAEIKVPDGEGFTAASRQTSVPTTVCFDGTPTPRLQRRRFPPRVPQFVSCTPIEWHRALTRSKISVVLKLYDPLAVLGRWEDAGGHPLFPGEMKCSLSAGSLLDGATPTEAVGADTTTGSGPELVDPSQQQQQQQQQQAAAAAAAPAIRCPPIKERRMEVDLRWPYALAIKRLCWFLGEHEDSCVIMTAPPLSGDAFAFSYRHCPSSLLAEEAAVAWSTVAARGPPALPNRLNELHCLFAQKQGQPRYRDVTRPPDEVFVSEVQYHFALLPRPVNFPSLGLKGVATDSDLTRAVLVRVFNSKVENVGCVLVEVDLDRAPTVYSFIERAQAQFSSEMVARGAPQHGHCRLLWVGALPTEPANYVQSSPIASRLDILNDATFKLRLGLLLRGGGGLQFDTPLRIEPEFSEAQLNDLSVSEALPPLRSLDDQILAPRALKVLVLHQNRERQYFGHPFLNVVSSCDTLKTMKEKIHAKLDLPYSSFRKWKFFVFDFEHTSFVKDDDVPDFSGGRFPCLLAVHRNIYAAEERSRTLQLHIK